MPSDHIRYRTYPFPLIYPHYDRIAAITDRSGNRSPVVDCTARPPAALFLKPGSWPSSTLWAKRYLAAWGWLLCYPLMSFGGDEKLSEGLWWDLEC